MQYKQSDQNWMFFNRTYRQAAIVNVAHQKLQLLVKLPPNLTIFGTKMANSPQLYEVHSFSTSPNSCQCTTVLNEDVPNCYIITKIILLVFLLRHGVCVTTTVPHWFPHNSSLITVFISTVALQAGNLPVCHLQLSKNETINNPILETLLNLWGNCLLNY